MIMKLFWFVYRRLSQRPTAEELEQRNILQRKLFSISPVLVRLVDYLTSHYQISRHDTNVPVDLEFSV